MRRLILYVYGASKPLCARDLARRCITESDPKTAMKAINYSLKKLADAGLILAIRTNSKVVHYVKVSDELPMFVLKAKGRKSLVTLETRRMTVQAADGSMVTIMDTGFLTDGARQVQNAQHQVEGNDNDEQEGEAPDARCRSSACG